MWLDFANIAVPGNIAGFVSTIGPIAGVFGRKKRVKKIGKKKDKWGALGLSSFEKTRAHFFLCRCDYGQNLIGGGRGFFRRISNVF